MTAVSISVIALTWLFIGLGCWLGWQLLRQNGRILLRLDELEKRLDELEFDESSSSRREETQTGNSEIRDPRSETDQSLVTSAAASRFGNRSLARSKIKRDGLKAGTRAPDFRLPRLDGGELCLAALRGRRVLLVFSDPHCGPCNALAPKLQEFHQENGATTPLRSLRRSPALGDVQNSHEHPLTLSLSPSEGERGNGSEVAVVMISRGEPKENRAKVKEHGFTFPVLLQQRWEISRLYAMFATPVAYLINECGIITHDVAVGQEPILNLMQECASLRTLAATSAA